MSEGDIILYRTDDGTAQFRLAMTDGSVCLSQAEIADLYQITPQAMTQHVKAIYAEGELTEEATCKSDLQVRTQGKPRVQQPFTFNERPLLNGTGRISHDAMKHIAHDRYDQFDRQRKSQEAIAADAADLEELKALEAEVSKTRKGYGR